jgi:hypothetical protein
MHSRNFSHRAGLVMPDAGVAVVTDYITRRLPTMMLVQRRLWSFIVTVLIMHAAAFLPTAAWSESTAPGSAPKIAVDSESFDFGKVKDNEVLEHSFKIFNKGSAPLEIKDVKPT